VTRDTGLFTHYPKTRTAEHPACDVVGRDVEVILRRPIAGESASAVRLDGLTNL
jgi:hypothetical protein